MHQTYEDMVHAGSNLMLSPIVSWNWNYYCWWTGVNWQKSHCSGPGTYDLKNRIIVVGLVPSDESFVHTGRKNMWVADRSERIKGGACVGEHLILK